MIFFNMKHNYLKKGIRIIIQYNLYFKLIYYKDIQSLQLDIVTSVIFIYRK
jgi:hypothetical protein